MAPSQPLVAVAYLSSAVVPPSEAMLEALLVDARAFNAKAGVTGALLLHDQTFFQYFEGPAQGVEQVYARIRASRVHGNIFELLYEPIEERAFSSWLMGFASAPGSLVLQLEQAQWHLAVGDKKSQSHRSDGLNLLLQFWGRSRGGV